MSGGRFAPVKNNIRHGVKDILLRRKSYIKRCRGHPGVHLVRPRFLDILRVLGFALLEIMVETDFADNVQSAVRSTSAAFYRINL